MGTRNGLSRPQAGTHRMWPINSTRWGFRMQSAPQMDEDQPPPQVRKVDNAKADASRLNARRPQQE
ncbi:MAG: hypothetical protein KF814_00860 [Nitrospiraceae bacterium]|nr:hypothetical protein [Nitrospiraceae bacterium]